MNDPFADEPGTHGHNPVTNFFAKLVGSQEVSDDAATSSDVPCVVTHHSRTNSRASGTHHPRTISEEIDDHMEGSQYQGTDICPGCHFARMSSVYCVATQLHHGTDLPMETPKKTKKPSLFARIRDSMTGLTPAGGENPDEVLPAPPEPSPPQSNPDSGAASPSHPGFSVSQLFRSKEERHQAELVQLEEKCRRDIKQLCKLASSEIGRQLASVHQTFRDLLRTHERQRNAMVLDCKSQFDAIYAQRKSELEQLRDEHKQEVKLVAKKEKERRKHDSESASSPVCEAPSQAAAPVPPAA